MTDEVPEEDRKRGCTFFILDETGETSITDTSVLNLVIPSNCTLDAESESTVLEEGEIREEAEEEAEEENKDPSTCLRSPLMRSSKKQRGGFTVSTPTSAQSRRRGSKRKRKQTLSTPIVPKTKRPKKRTKKKKNSVIVLDSDSESEHEVAIVPDVSVINIADESNSVIVLSDDEVGVCSGSVSTSKSTVKTFKEVTPKKKKKNNPSAPGPSRAAEPAPKKPLEAPGQSKNFELYQPLADQCGNKTGLRPIVIDGCNVAFGHGRDRFSSLGLKICIDYFKNMGHEVRAFVPQFRKTHSATTDSHLLDAMEKEGTLSFTPSRRTDGKMIVSYDDRFIVQYADANGGVIVSRDNYRDLLNENPEWKETIYKRLLMFTWVGDTIMFPKDPLGRGGPTLQEFLKF